MYEQCYDLQHLHLIQKIRRDGTVSSDRTGTGTMKLFGQNIYIDASDGYLPLFRGRMISARIAFEEMMWMLRGETDVAKLQEKNIKIWDGNTTREALDSYGKHHIKENTIGKGYGHQFRNFNGVDQLWEVISEIKKNPNGRRHVINLWNPADFNDMVLHPCHLLYEFMVQDDVINIHQHIRSNDVVLGQPFNIIFATMFLGLVAKLLNYKMGTVWQSITDAHVYSNHFDGVDKLFSEIEGREDEWISLMRKTPTWKINKDINTFEDMLETQWEDIEISNYDYLTKLGRKDFPMAV